MTQSVRIIRLTRTITPEKKTRNIAAALEIGKEIDSFQEKAVKMIEELVKVLETHK